MLCIAQFLEVLHEVEKQAAHSRKPTTRSRFMTNGLADTTDTERVVQEVLAQLAMTREWVVDSSPPVQSESIVQRGKTSNPPSVQSLGIVGVDVPLQHREDLVTVESLCNVIIVRAMGILPSNACQPISIGSGRTACLFRQGIPPGTLLRTVSKPKTRQLEQVFKLCRGCPKRPKGNPVVRMECTNSCDSCDQGSDRR